MLNKSEKKILKLENVFPTLTKDKIVPLLKEFNLISPIKIPENLDLNNLPLDLASILDRVYVKKSLKILPAIKARFLQYLIYSENFLGINILKNNQIHSEELTINLLLKDEGNDTKIGVIFIENLDSKMFEPLNDLIKELGEHNPEEITILYLVCASTERKILNKLLILSDQLLNLHIDCFIEYEDSNRPFDDADLLLLDDIKIYGFNFGALDDALSVLMKEKGKGKFVISKQDLDGNIEEIWEGLIFPRALIKK